MKKTTKTMTIIAIATMMGCICSQAFAAFPPYSPFAPTPFSPHHSSHGVVSQNVR